MDRPRTRTAEAIQRIAQALVLEYEPIQELPAYRDSVPDKRSGDLLMLLVDQLSQHARQTAALLKSEGVASDDLAGITAPLAGFGPAPARLPPRTVDARGMPGPPVGKAAAHGLDIPRVGTDGRRPLRDTLLAMAGQEEGHVRIVADILSSLAAQIWYRR